MKSAPGAVFALLAPACYAAVGSSTLQADHNSADWAAYGRTYDEGHFSPLEQVDTNTVRRLGLLWYHDLDTGQRTDTQPLAADGVVYLTTGQSIVRALDGRTGKLLWRYDPQAGRASGLKLRSTWGVRGLALWGRHVLVATTDGRLISIDASSGRPAWTAQTLDPKDETYITGAPRVFDGKVLVGFAGGDRLGTRGAVTCYDAESGKQLWKFYTVPGDLSAGFANQAMRDAARTWSGKFWKVGGGGAVWNAITYDPQLKRVYLGTGNANPWNPHIRNGKEPLDNLYTASIVALDANTGKYVWHYQENPGDAWDYDAVADIELATLEIDGKPRRVLIQAAKNGFMYVIDRDTGQLVAADKYGKVTWAERIDLTTGRPLELPGNRYEKPIVVWPGNIGMHNWQAMSYSATDHLVFVPAVNMAANYNMTGVDVETWRPIPHAWTTGLGDTESGLPEDQFGSSLLAWDPVKKSVAWRHPTAGMWNGGIMSTAGGLVFQGQLDGAFNAYDARSGAVLWQYDAKVAALGAPISYSVGDKQYITVLVGPPVGSAAYEPDAPGFGWRYRDHPRRVLTFALDATTPLPASPPPGPATPIVTGPPADAKLAGKGAMLFGMNCISCHGHNAVSGGSGPDLRASSVPLCAAAFKAVVSGGALVDRGMPQYAELSSEQLESLRNYVRAEAQRTSH